MGQRTDWNEYSFGLRPGLYGDNLAKTIGVKRAPVDEKIAADFMGLDIREISVGETEAEAQKYGTRLPKIKGFLNKVCAILDKTRNLILLNAENPRVQKRTGCFHEIGHGGLHWHQGLNYFCSESCFDSQNHKQAEREAFQCGAAVQMPSFLFLPDMASLSVGEEAIKRLASRYDASLETTAIRYAAICRGMVAVIVAEPIPTIPVSSEGGCLPLFQSLPVLPAPDKAVLWLSDKTFRGDPISEGVIFPLQIKHATTSGRFPKQFIPHGTPIPETSPIYSTYMTGKTWRGELAPHDIGSSHGRPPFLAECFVFGTNSDRKVMIVLWRPDKQLSFLGEAA